MPRKLVTVKMLLNRIVHTEAPKVVSSSREIGAPADKIFELIADPSLQPRWDGNNNLAEAPTGQRVRAVGDVFTMTITMGSVRENHVVEFEEGRLIAWRHEQLVEALLRRNGDSAEAITREHIVTALRVIQDNTR